MKPALWLALLGLHAASAALADADHGHDHGAAPQAATAAAPRFAAAGEGFELVGVLEGRRLTLYLDHAASNAPVNNAQLELEFGGSKLVLKPQGEGAFEATLAHEAKPGLTAITATVSTPQGSARLAAELELHEAPHEEAAHGRGWPVKAALAVAALSLIGVALGWGSARRRRLGRSAA